MTSLLLSLLFLCGFIFLFCLVDPKCSLPTPSSSRVEKIIMTWKAYGRLSRDKESLAVIGKAFSEWNAHTFPYLEFRPAKTKEPSSKVNVVISFERHKHRYIFLQNNDCDSFDGRGRIAGHATSLFWTQPGALVRQAEIHLDADENWCKSCMSVTTDRTRISLYVVLLHEIGHVLGLPHVADETSIMNPRSNERRQQLSSYDKKTIKLKLSKMKYYCTLKNVRATRVSDA